MTQRAKRRRFPLQHREDAAAHLMSCVPAVLYERQLCGKWKKPVSYVRQVVAHVLADWEDAAQTVAPYRRTQLRQSWEKLLQVCNAKEERHNVIRVLENLGKLDGAYAPTRHDVAVAGAVGVGISLGPLGLTSPDEVRQRIEYLREQLASRGPIAVQGTVAANAQAQLVGATAPDAAGGEPGDD